MASLPCANGTLDVPKAFGYDPHGHLIHRDSRFEVLFANKLESLDFSAKMVSTDVVTSRDKDSDLSVGSCSSNVILYGTNVSAYAQNNLDITADNTVYIAGPNVYIGENSNVFVNGIAMNFSGSGITGIADYGTGESVIQDFDGSTVTFRTFSGNHGVGVQHVGGVGLVVDLSEVTDNYTYANAGPAGFADGWLVSRGSWSDRTRGSQYTGPTTLTTSMQTVTYSTAQTCPWFTLATSGQITASVECDLWAHCLIARDNDLDSLTVDGSVPPGLSSSLDILVGIAAINGSVIRTYTSVSKNLELVLPPTHFAAGDVLIFQVGMTAPGGGQISTVLSKVTVGVAN